MNHLEINHLTKTYRNAGRPAVSDASFSLATGELLTIVGESGSGKTSLLRLLAGLEIPDSGTITLGGETISAPGRVLAPERRGIGMVFQHHALFPHLTVGKNIAFGIRGRSRREQEETTATLLELMGLPGIGKRYPHQLSGGERQRIALARALAPEPKLLLLDEPFSSLDPRLRLELREETRAILKRHGTTSIFVTHDTADALAMADRIVILREGVIQQSGTPLEIYLSPANPYVASFFGHCNFIPRPDFLSTRHIGPASATEGTWVRPEHLSLSGEGTDGLHGVVRSTSFRGAYFEVVLECRCEIHGAFDVVVFHTHDPDITIGASRRIVPRGHV